MLLADGAIGTLLTSRGAQPGQARSPLNLSDPESVREVHDDYLDAGVRILTTNTWDANRVKLTAHEWADSLERINREGVRLAKDAAVGEHVFIAGSLGPARRAGQALRHACSSRRCARSSRSRLGSFWSREWI